MTWIAIGDGRHAILPLSGGQTGALVPVGSLVIETLFSAEPDRPQTVLEMARLDGWQRRFAITLRADGEVRVENRQGPAVSNARLHLTRTAHDATLRVTYAWHAPARHGVLSVENLDAGTVEQAIFDDPHPLPMDDIAALTGGSDLVAAHPAVSLIACADDIEPVGQTPGYAMGTEIDTISGPRPIESLKPGDLVETADQGFLAVRHVITRDLPALGRYAPVRLRAPFFGLRRDLTVSADHRIMIAGADAEYLFGSDSVLVEARHLARMAAVPRRWRNPTIRYLQVVLDVHTCLSLSGAWGESLFLDDLADRPVRLATSALSHVPQQDLPRHRQIASPQLETYEAMVLVSALRA